MFGSFRGRSLGQAFRLVFPMEPHALLIIINGLVPLRVDERDLLPAVEDRRPHLAVDAVVVEKEGLLAFHFALQLLEVREEALADELAVVDHLGVALACARRRSDAVDATRVVVGVCVCEPRGDGLDDAYAVDATASAHAPATRRVSRRRDGATSGRGNKRMLAGTSNKKSKESSTTSSPRPSGKTLIRRSINVSTRSSFGWCSKSRRNGDLYPFAIVWISFNRRFFVFLFGCFINNQSLSLLTVILQGTRVFFE